MTSRHTCWSARNSRVFLPILEQAIEAARPSITVMGGWSPNDGMRTDKDQAYLQRIQRTTELIESQGGLQILLKGVPRQLYGNEELASWQRVNEDLQHLFPNAAVFDPLPLLQDPERPGNWRPEMSNDGYHPNFAANLALRTPFEALLRRLL